jgi:hypothetical protein
VGGLGKIGGGCEEKEDSRGRVHCTFTQNLRDIRVASKSRSIVPARSSCSERDVSQESSESVWCVGDFQGWWFSKSGHVRNDGAAEGCDIRQ